MKRLLQQIAGGLGNQLFMWVGAHALAEQNSRLVSLFYSKETAKDESRYIGISKCLEKCTHGISAKQDNLSILQIKLRDKFFMHDLVQENNYSKKTFGVLDIPDNMTDLNAGRARIIRGYFQNSSLVSEYKEVVKNEIMKPLNDSFIALSRSKRIFPDSYQCLHIRRGDRKFHAQTHGNLSYKYYQRGLSKRLPIIIVTDDDSIIDDLKNSFRAHLVFGTELNPWETLAVMGNSSRLIAANSTLSWWGGYVSLDNNAEVIFPESWTKDLKSAPKNLHLEEVVYLRSDFEI